MLLLIFSALLALLVAYFIVYHLDRHLGYVNNFLARHCENRAVFDPKEFKWTTDFRANWKSVRDEYLQYATSNDLRKFKSINADMCDFDINDGWKVVFLRVYGLDTELATKFPNTMRLINQSECTLAFFSIFEPHTKLRPHYGVYKGVLRYHLPLIVPDEWDKCFINVHGRVLNWRFEKGLPIDLIFDDTYLHHAENNTDQRRVILFLDIKRDFKNPVINSMNTILLRFIRSNDAVKKTLKAANSFD